MISVQNLKSELSWSWAQLEADPLLFYSLKNYPLMGGVIELFKQINEINLDDSNELSGRLISSLF